MSSRELQQRRSRVSVVPGIRAELAEVNALARAGVMDEQGDPPRPRSNRDGEDDLLWSR
jgi:hypothetical protein